MIVGITGTLGAGKGTVVEFLKRKGFLHFSVRDFLTRELVRQGREVSQLNFATLANEIRAEKGSSYILEKLYEEAREKGGDVVIESFRCPGEVEALRDKDGFVLWSVDADVETRFSRIVERESSAVDEKNFDFQTFVSREQAQMNNTDPTKQNLGKCIEMADHLFRNDWTVAELEGKVEKVLGSLAGKVEKKGVYVRPSWDEYFINIMRVVAGRVTCDRARAGGGGCVVVKDKQILVTGYVGSPSGCAHCDDVGHEFRGKVHEDGKITNHCVRTTHAEQNAICQAARRGVALDGATLYNFMFPCYTCAKLIIGAGIKRVVILKDYHASKDSKRIFDEAGVKYELLDKEVVKYDKM
jgi:dCMP deaminase